MIFTLEIMKTRTVNNEKDLDDLRESIQRAASLALDSIARLRKDGDMRALWHMKFQSIGFDPIDGFSSLNLIEQINQSFTYVASVEALKVLLAKHSDLAPFTLHLGTASGSDIESSKGGGLAAEVFAAVTPSNNQKLKNDIAKVGGTGAKYKYVFFMSPGYEPGRCRDLETVSGIEVWSVGERQ